MCVWVWEGVAHNPITIIKGNQGEFQQGHLAFLYAYISYILLLLIYFNNDNE